MNKIINIFTNGWLHYLIVGSIAAFVIVLIAMFILKVLRIRKPLYRHMIWLYCLVGIIVLPMIWLYGPKLKVPILPARSGIDVSFRLPATEPDIDSLSYDIGLTHSDSIVPLEHTEHIVSWKTAVVTIWFIGFFIMLTRLAVGWSHLRRICRSAKPIQVSESHADLANLRIRLCLTSELDGPVCFGVFQPIIILPEEMYNSGNSDNIRMVLAHELAHIKRRDCWTNFFQRITESIYFFHPLVWLASKQLTQQREDICDNHVLAKGISADDYTALLSHIGAQSASSGYLQTVALFEGQLLSRIRSLLDKTRSCETRLSWRVSAFCTVAILLGFLVFGSIKLVAKPFNLANSVVNSSSVPVSVFRKQESSTNSAMIPTDNEQARYITRTFNSNVAFDVWVQKTLSPSGPSGFSPQSIGTTPSATPLDIPACWLWGVQVSAPIKDLNLLRQELSRNEVPGLIIQNAADTDLKQLAGLAKLRMLILVRSKITDESMDYMKSLSHLEQLIIPDTLITDAGMESLKGLTELKNLDLDGTQITGKGLEYIKGMTGLRSLQLERTKITNVSLEYLKDLTDLIYLALNDTNITDAGLEPLKGLKKLERLDLWNTQITDAGLSHIDSLKRLKELDLSNTKVTNVGLEHLKGLTDLRTLYLHKLPITDAGLEHIKDLMTHLQHLNLPNTQVTDAGLAYLKGATKLEHLDLRNTSVGDNGLEQIKNLTGLHILMLGGTRITDAGLVYLKGMTELQRLEIANTQVTDLGIQQLQQSLPNLSIVRRQRQQPMTLVEDQSGASDRQSEQPRFAARTFNSNLALSVSFIETPGGPGKYIGDTPSEIPLKIPPCWLWSVRTSGLMEDYEALASDMSLNNIPGLALTSCKDSDLKYLANLKDLRVLMIFMSSITDVGLEHLKNLTQLEQLHLVAAQITDDSLTYIKGMTRLETLNLTGTQITDAGLTDLKSLTGLHELYLSGTQVTDAGLQQITDLKELSLLNLLNTQVTDAGLEYIKGLSKLQSMELGGTQITEAGIQRLKRSLPNVVVTWNHSQIPPWDVIKPDGGTETAVQPRYAARTFNSNLTFLVLVQETPLSEGRLTMKAVGSTPCAVPLEIPACWLWGVLPSAPVQDWDLVTKEINQNEIPGLIMQSAVDSDMKQFVSLSKLRMLTVVYSKISGESLKYLKNMSQLEFLNLQYTPITDADLEHLKDLNRLEYLDLSGTKVTDAGIQKLKQSLPNVNIISSQLRTQSNDKPTIDNEAIQQPRYAAQTFNSDIAFEVWIQDMFPNSTRKIGQTPSSNPIQIPACWLWGVQPVASENDWNLLINELNQNDIPGLTLDAVDSNLKELAGLSKLQALNLRNSKITDAGLEYITLIPQLEQLDLMGTPISDEGLVYLKSMTTLKNLNLSMTQITDNGLDNIKDIANLEKLVLISTKVTNAGLEHIKGMDRLKMLILSGSSINNTGLEYIKGMTGLKTLVLPGTSITDAGMEYIEEMNSLEALSLQSTQITDIGLENLKGLTNLHGLDLGGTKITDTGLIYLEGLTKLQDLNLRGTKVTDAGLVHLNDLSKLLFLYIQGTNVTDDGIQKLQQSLPNLTIYK